MADLWVTLNPDNILSIGYPKRLIFFAYQRSAPKVSLVDITSPHWLNGEFLRQKPMQLVSLDNAKSKNDINVPAWKLHELKGDLKGHYLISVSGN
jgi:plasmid maintenance system killer protein